jgi:hypothetical protein
VATSTSTPTDRPAIAARDDIAPSGKQRAYIARLCLELLTLPYPESRKDAAELIDSLKRQCEAQRPSPASTDDIPF